MFRTMFSLNVGSKVHTKGSRGMKYGPMVYQRRALSNHRDQSPYWKTLAPFRDVTAEEFKSYRFQLRNTVQGVSKLRKFLTEVLPDRLQPSKNTLLQHIKTREQFVEDAIAGLKVAPMTIRLTPQILSRIDWANALDDPVRKQFLSLKSGITPDHKELTLDSLHEEADSPVPGLVHRYPGRALFLATSICPVYCRFCTRSYAVGANTDTVSKSPQKPSRKRWELVFQHIEKDASIEDIVVSGGDAYYLLPEDLREIGNRLLDIRHLRRIRFASKGLAVAPGRILDDTDTWASALIDLSNRGRKEGKQVCLHTHFNHANEITWITREAANKLFRNGVIVRNQSVLLKGVNDNEVDMGNLIKELADMNIQPYYVYQCDMVRGIEDLRTPLSTILRLDKNIRGTFSGFMIPSFVVDLPGGGGKRLVATVERYDPATGVAEFKAPGLPGEKGKKTYFYHDPVPQTIEEAQIAHNKREHEPIAVQQNEFTQTPSTKHPQGAIYNEIATKTQDSNQRVAEQQSPVVVIDDILSDLDDYEVPQKHAAAGGLKYPHRTLGQRVLDASSNPIDS